MRIPLIIPEDNVFDNPRGFPIAITFSPIDILFELPSFTTGRSNPFTFKIAISLCSSFDQSSLMFSSFTGDFVFTILIYSSKEGSTYYLIKTTF